MKRRLALLLIFALCICMMACGAIQNDEDIVPVVTEATVAAEPAATTEDIVILYTNDVHSYIDKVFSYDVIAGLKDALTEKYGNVLLVDAGDAIQGTAYGSMDKGRSIVGLMSAAGYDLATLGNHEFDYGMEGCLNAVSWAEYTYVSSNFYHEKNGIKGETVLEAYKLFDIGGRKIAFVGITAPETFTKSTPAYFQDDSGNYIYGLSGGVDGIDLQADVQAAIDAAKAEGAEIVIALGHLGDDLTSCPWTSYETIAQISGLDAFIDGHSHSTIVGDYITDKDGNEVLLTQTGEYFDAIGMMLIDGETGTITTDLISYKELTEPVVDEYGESVLDENGDPLTEVTGYEFVSNIDLGVTWCVDAEVNALKNLWIDEIDVRLGAVIGTAVITLDNYTEDGKRLVRMQETNSGDFCADALYYLFDDMQLDVDVAIVNGGGVRNKALTGELTYKTAKDMEPFGNVACLQIVTGQQLLDALEWGSRAVGTPEELGAFLHVSGIRFTINSQWPSTVRYDEKEVWIGGPTGGYRVQDVEVYNKETDAYEPLDLEATYNLAGYNYNLRDLGGGYGMFQESANILDYVMEDYMVLAHYIQSFENHMVDAVNSPLLQKYPGMLLDYSDVNGCGRINIQ